MTYKSSITFALLHKLACWELWLALSLAGFLCATAVNGRSRGLPPTLYRPDSPKNQSGQVPELPPKAGGVGVSPALSIIKEAAERNGIKYGSDNWFILLAIRKAENGRDGLQFGIMNPKAYNLDKQAGWAAATVVKTRMRWQRQGCPADFLSFLQKRYCPDNEGGETWLKNVRWFYNKFKEK